MAKPAKRGNSDIGHMKRYNPEQRERISKIVRDEWSKTSSQWRSGAEFVAHLKKVMAKEGIKSPEGKALSTRTVRFQVQRSGIAFREAKFGQPVAGSRTTTEALGPLQVPSNARIEGVPATLKAILTDDSLTASQALKLVKAFFGIEV